MQPEQPVQHQAVCTFILCTRRGMTAADSCGHSLRVMMLRMWQLVGSYISSRLRCLGTFGRLHDVCVWNSMQVSIYLITVLGVFHSLSQPSVHTRKCAQQVWQASVRGPRGVEVRSQQGCGGGVQHTVYSIRDAR